MNSVEQKLFQKIPKVFQTRDVMIESIKMGYSRSWAWQTLDNWKINGFVEWLKRGKYKKIGGDAITKEY